MKYSVVYSGNAARQLSKMDKHDARRIYSWVDKHLAGTKDPRIFGKRLSENFAGLLRYRIGKYRLVAEVRDSEVIIEIIKVGHRSNMYSN